MPTNGTFVAFPAEEVRTTKNNIKFMVEDFKEGRTTMAWQRFFGLAFSKTAGYSIPIVTAAFAGVSAEDEEELRKDEPSYYQNAAMIYWSKDEANNFLAANISYSVPGEYFGQTARAFFNEEAPLPALKAALTEALAPFVSVDMTTSTLASVWNNQTPEGFKVYGNGSERGFDFDGDWRKFGQALSFVMDRALAPGYFTKGKNIVRSLGSETGEVTTISEWFGEKAGGVIGNGGRVFETATETGKALGWSTRTIDAKERRAHNIRRKMQEYDTEVKDLEDLIIGEVGRIDPDRARKIAEDRYPKILQKQQEIAELSVYMRDQFSRGNVVRSYNDIKGDNRSIGLTANEYSTLMRRGSLNFELSNNTVERAIRKFDKTAANNLSPEAANIRRRMIRQNFRQLQSSLRQIQREVEPSR